MCEWLMGTFAELALYVCARVCYPSECTKPGGLWRVCDLRLQHVFRWHMFRAVSGKCAQWKCANKIGTREPRESLAHQQEHPGICRRDAAKRNSLIRSWTVGAPNQCIVIYHHFSVRVRSHARGLALRTSQVKIQFRSCHRIYWSNRPLRSTNLDLTSIRCAFKAQCRCVCAS